VIGKVAPDRVKPAPVSVAALTVTAEVPVEDKVRVWVVAVFIATLPNTKLVVLIPSVGTAAFSCRA